uniref:B-cell receptor CD22 n=1 Tax=Oncorhynchus mykiss TaxID=8022 RepID=A0A8L0DRQ2_ONCMY
MSLRTAGSVLVVFLWSVTVVLGQDDWSVSYTTQSICTFKESTVELSSSYTYPSGYTVTTTFWFTKYNAEGPVSLSDDPDYKGRVTYSKNKENGHTLTITDLRESDSARYKFRFTDQTGKWRYTGEPGVALSVTGLQVKLTVGFWYNTLTCSTTCTLPDNPTYIWYKNGHKEKEDTSSSYPDSFSDVDSYSCAVKGHEDLLSPAVCQKCWSVTYTQQSICTLKGSTVDISCSYTYPSDHEIKKAFWFTKWSDKDAEDLSSAPGYEGHIEYLGDKESDCTLRITDLRLSDSAGYRFRFITTRDKFAGSPVSLTVTVLQVKMRTSRFSSWVTLTCSTTCTLTDSPTYIWYRNGHKVKEDTSSQYSDYLRNADSYSCAVKGHDNLHSPAVCVRGQNCWSVTYPHQGVCALKGSTVDISSTYDSGDATITSSHWFSSKQSSSWKDELVPEDLTTDPGYAGRVEYVGEKESGRSTLRITDLREEDSAEYKFIFNTQTSGWGYSFPGTTLTVTGLQVKVIGKTLTCSTTCTLTDNPTYIWYKNGHKVKEDTSSLYSDSFSDTDRYSCAVKGHEDLHSLAVCKNCWIVTYTHQSICALKGSTVDISCSYTYPIDHEIKTTFWFTKWESDMDPEDLSSVPGYEGHIEYLGDKKSEGTLRITDLRLSDSAEYRFRLITSGEKFAGSPVSLTVTDVVLEMVPTSVSESESVTLTCRTKCTLDPIAAFIWYKNGQPIPNSNTSSPVYSLFSVSSEDTGRYSCAVEGHEDLPSAEETLTVRCKFKPLVWYYNIVLTDISST